MAVQNDDLEEPSPTVRVRVPAEARQGVYANVSLVSHSGHEFTIDFCQTQPAGKSKEVSADVVSRVHLPPTLVPSLITALQGNVAAYEGQFGAIPEVR